MSDPLEHHARAASRFGDVDARWRAVEDRDSAADGAFFIAVRTTGVYCRPTCPARRPLRRNVEFHATAADAEAAGFRPCKRCRPGGGSGREGDSPDPQPAAGTSG